MPEGKKPKLIVTTQEMIEDNENSMLKVAQEVLAKKNKERKEAAKK